MDQEHERLIREAKTSLIKVQQCADMKRKAYNEYLALQTLYTVLQHESALAQSRVHLHYLEMLRTGIVPIEAQPRPPKCTHCGTVVYDRKTCTKCKQEVTISA